MIDIHSHILPEIDDGAKTVEESVALLEQMRKQNVTTVIATPHFYPDRENLEDFLNKRYKAYKKLTDKVGDNFPLKILLGAEVLYFSNIGSVEAVKQLTVEKSPYLLLELLGINKIDDKVINDIIALKENLGLIPIIAHIERYYRYKGYKRLLELFKSGGALCHINATFLTSKAEKKVAVKLIDGQIADFIASDCHCPKNRPVMLKSAFDTAYSMSKEGTERIIKKTEKLEKELIDFYGK